MNIIINDMKQDFRIYELPYWNFSTFSALTLWKTSFFIMRSLETLQSALNILGCLQRLPTYASTAPAFFGSGHSSVVRDQNKNRTKQKAMPSMEKLHLAEIGKNFVSFEMNQHRDGTRPNSAWICQSFSNDPTRCPRRI